MFNMFSGGALQRFTIFALGSCPTSPRRSSCSSSRCVSAFESLKKEANRPPQDHPVHPLRHRRPGAGPGAADFDRPGDQPGWCSSRADVRLTTHHAGHRHHVPDVLGEQITERGLGNGISMIIFAVSPRPANSSSLLDLVNNGSMNALTAIFVVALVGL